MVGDCPRVPHLKLAVKYLLYAVKYKCGCRQIARILREELAAWMQVNLPVLTGKLHVTRLNCVWGFFTSGQQVKWPEFAGNFARSSFTVYFFDTYFILFDTISLYFEFSERVSKLKMTVEQPLLTMKTTILSLVMEPQNWWTCDRKLIPYRVINEIVHKQFNLQFIEINFKLDFQSICLKIGGLRFELESHGAYKSMFKCFHNNMERKRNDISKLSRKLQQIKNYISYSIGTIIFILRHISDWESTIFLSNGAFFYPMSANCVHTINCCAKKFP